MLMSRSEVGVVRIPKRSEYGYVVISIIGFLIVYPFLIRKLKYTLVLLRLHFYKQLGDLSINNIYIGLYIYFVKNKYKTKHKTNQEHSKTQDKART